MNDKLRKVMRCIALGLPVVIPVVTAPFNVGGCYPLGYQCPTTIEQVIVEYTPTEEGAAIDCRAVCGGDMACQLVEPGRVACMHEVVDCPPAGRRPNGA